MWVRSHANYMCNPHQVIHLFKKWYIKLIFFITGTGTSTAASTVLTSQATPHSVSSGIDTKSK